MESVNANLYEGIDIESLAKGGLVPFEALTIRNGQEKCLIHRKKFEKIQVTYQIGRGTFSVTPYFCRECNRLYLEESKASYQDALRTRGIDALIYSLEESDDYVKSRLPETEIGEDGEIYVPDVWIEENPTCQIHGATLEQLPCAYISQGEKVKFTAYFCAQCNKIILRRSKALDLEEECAEKGIPMLKIFPLTARKPEKKKVSPKLITPDYFIDNGRKEKFTYKNSPDFYRLTEEDTIVVSDSVYCNLTDHETEEAEIVFWVNQKKDGRKLFLCLAGYCAECQKYYMAEEDYKTVYSLGRPELTVINSLEDSDYEITSGEVFNLEKTHLGNLESDFKKIVKSIYEADDYAGLYSTGAYDDGVLSSAKEYSLKKYGPILEKIEAYQPKPYSYRVDIVFNGKPEVYYVGVDDIEIDGQRRVISLSSDFGRKLVNYRTLHVFKDGKRYDIQLSREFDIENAQLYGYVNLRTDEDSIFAAGITDPFLIRVLNLRKKQHNLVDIFTTIQENQNAIVDDKFTQNIIVQGCAGSGKTMVMLHRLSALKYNHREFDFTTQAIILTPNEQFNLHIKGLAEGLQIGNIERASVEQYYVDMLRKYAHEFVPNGKVASEIFVNQKYVDYIYSEAFFEKLKISYFETMEERKQLLPLLQGVTESFGENYTAPNVNNDSDLIPKIRTRVVYYSNLAAKREKEINEAKEKLYSLERRKEELSDLIPKTEERAATIVQTTLPNVFTKMREYIAQLQSAIDEQDNIIAQLTEETAQVEGRVLLFGKAAKLEELKKETDKAERKKKSTASKLDDATQAFDFQTDGKTDEEILAWMKQLTLYIGDVREDIRTCENAKKALEDYREEWGGIDSSIAEAQGKYDKKNAEKYSEEALKGLSYLQEKITEYSDFNTFKIVFDKATEEFITANNVKVNKAVHRYDLYARLWFCMQYYAKRVGTSTFICVDEGQDVAENEYRLIYELNHRSAVFNIYGDVNQLLKLGRGISSWDKMIEKYHMSLYQLNENYRNTNQITRFCNSSFDMNVLQTGVDGAKVREIPRRDLEKELASLSINNERIAILLPRSVQKNHYLVRDVLPAYIKGIIGEKIDNGYISLMYVDEVKGIEFDKVYVVPNKMNKNEKYIAYTRALSELILVVDEQIVDRQPTEESDEELSPEQKIASEMKKRGIQYFAHFTSLENLDSILRFGILPISKLKELDIEYSGNDEKRLDRHYDAVSLSVSYPNDKLLYALMDKDSDKKWVILLCDAYKLIEMDTAYYPSNAANSRFNSFEWDMFTGEKCFSDMFTQEGRDGDLLPSMSTDSQAEVMVRGEIPVSAITKIVFRDKETAEDFLQEHLELKDKTEVSKALFGPRGGIRN